MTEPKIACEKCANKLICKYKDRFASFQEEQQEAYRKFVGGLNLGEIGLFSCRICCAMYKNSSTSVVRNS